MSAPRSDNHTKTSTLVVYLALATLVVLIYAQTAAFQFVNYDDEAYVSRNPHVTTGLSTDNLHWAFTTSYFNNWHPLTWVSHMIDCQIFGVNPGAHHLVNGLFHLANAVLLFEILRRTTHRQAASAVVALLFAVHPLRVESVAWISERKDVLSTFFALLAINAFRRYAMQPGIIRYLLVALWLALGLMAKSMIVTLPLLLLLLDYWPLERKPNPLYPPSRFAMRRFGLLFLEKIPLLLLAVAFAVIAMLLRTQQTAESTARASNALVAYVAYIGKMLCPTGLIPFYPIPEETRPIGQPIAAMVILLGISGAVLRFSRTRPYLLVGWFWYLIALAPVAGFVQIGAHAMADRYTYLPLVGLFIIIAWGGGDLAASLRIPKTLRTALIVILIASQTILSAIQTHHWKNSQSLFQHTLAVDSQNYFAHYSLGCDYLDKKDYENAALEFRKAIEIRPSNLASLSNLGLALTNLGKNEEAIQYCLAALKLKPGHPNTLVNLGAALINAGRPAEAAPYLTAVLDSDSQIPPDTRLNAHYNLGVAFDKLGKFEQGIVEFTEVLRLDPKFPDACRRLARAHVNRGIVLATANRLDEAIDHLRKALTLKPDLFNARFNLANALLLQGNFPKAAALFAEVVQAKPSDAGAHYHLGLALAGLGKNDEAAAQFAETLRINPDHVDAAQHLKALQKP